MAKIIVRERVLNRVRCVFSIMLAFGASLLTLATALAEDGALPTRPVPSVGDQTFELSGAGDCLSEHGSVNMRAIVFLPGNTAEANDGPMRLRVSFSNDHVGIEELGRPE